MTFDIRLIGLNFTIESIPFQPLCGMVTMKYKINGTK